ncbi:MAG: HAMP domain-containing protein [Proteobacteria bacterium]|nr:HAMP domain-containing protein [Pseudomonadota bacterium]
MTAAVLPTAVEHARPRRFLHFGLRARIVLPLLVPVIGLLLLSGRLVMGRLETVAAMQRVSVLSHLVNDTGALLHELQRERGASGVFLGSKGTELREVLPVQRARTDARLAAFNAELAHIAAADAVPRHGPLARAIAAAGSALSHLGAIRNQISGLAIPASTSSAYFTATNARLLDMVGKAADTAEAPQVARAISTYLSFLAAKELAGQERAIGAAGFAAGRFDAAQLRQLIRRIDEQSLYFDLIAKRATPAQVAFMRRTVAGAPVEAVVRMRRAAETGGLAGKLAGITGADWFKATTARIDLLKKVEDRFARDLTVLTNRTRRAARSGLFVAVGTIIALLGITAAIGAAMIRAIVRPLDAHIRAMQRLADGETDITIAGAARNDELGSMARAITIFRDQANENRRLAAAQETERNRAEAEKLAALRSMAETIETETGTALVDVSNRTGAMEATADHMGASISRTETSAQGASAAAASALSNAQTVASAAEQLAASIREISGQVSQSSAVVGRAVAAADTTRATIDQLDTKVAQIGTVADIIRDIAAKTNLLALNATIEAARAGEAGKGFAVVASEVKGLAMQTAHSTEEITRHLAEVRGATRASVTAVGHIGETITEIDAIAASIAAAVEEQGAATAEIARNVAQTAQAAEEMTTRITEVSAEAAENGRQIGQVHQSAGDLARAVGELKRAVIRVVRTSTAAVDRRLVQRQDVRLRARLNVAGEPAQDGCVVELSEAGARIEEVSSLAPGTRGTLQVSGIAVALRFTVRNQYGDALGLLFEQDAAAAAAIRAVLDRQDLPRAA